MPLPGEVRVLSDPEAVALDAARWLADRSASDRPFRIAVSGGATPRLLYETLAAAPFSEGIAWARWHLFFADERDVPPDDARSNYRLVHDTLVSRVPMPAGQVHRMEANRPDLGAAATEYAQLLESECGRPPRLDVILLGLGTDGHTASLFPGSPALDVADAWVARSRAPQPPFDRLTLTLPVLDRAAHVGFIVTGASKAAALRAVSDGSVPAARVKPHRGEVVWFIDEDATRPRDAVR